MSLDPSDVQKILIVTLSNLGDVVLTLPVFQTVLKKFPKAELHVIVGEGAKDVFQGDDRIKKIIFYNRRMPLGEKIKFIGGVRGERYDLIIDLKRSLVGFFGGARHRNSYLSFFQKRKHHALKHLDALRGLVDGAGDEGVFLKVSQASVARVKELMAQDVENRKPRLVVAAVGSKSDIKKWPAEYFAKLLDRLVLADHCRVVLVGDKNDVEPSAKVKSLMRLPALDLSGKTNFEELCAILSEAELLITNDSAPLHIADHFRVPVLALFGPTDLLKYGPRFGSSAALSRKLFCSPCEKAQCRFAHECMKELGADQVYEKAVRILRDEPARKKLRILITRLDRVGDVALTLPSIQAIRRHFPQSFISVIVRPYTQDILEGHPLIDEVIPYYYEKKGRHSGLVGSVRFLKEISARRFDIAFVLHPSNRSNLIPFLASIPYRIGLRSPGSFFLLTKEIPDKRSEGLKHESDYTLDIVRAFGVQVPAQRSISMPVFSEDSFRVSKILEESFPGAPNKIIAIHPGASCPSKRWPRERFALLGKKIMENTAFSVVVVGGSEEMKMGRYIQEYLGPRALDLTGRLSLKELAALFEKSLVLISNDSGPVHIAAAVGTRVLCIYGRNRVGLGPKRWKPLGESHVLIHKDVGCVNCLAHRCTIEFECLKAIEVDEVYQKFTGMTYRTPSQREGLGVV